MTCQIADSLLFLLIINPSRAVKKSQEKDHRVECLERSSSYPESCEAFHAHLNTCLRYGSRSFGSRFIIDFSRCLEPGLLR
jgi:hypothetical protein